MKKIYLIAACIGSLAVLAQQSATRLRTGSQPQRVEIACQHNYFDTAVSFSVAHETTFLIKCSAEFLKIENLSITHSDCMQYFFDVNNDRKKAFDSRTDDRFFNVALEADTSKASFKVKQTGPQSIVFEAFIPWEKIGKKPQAGDFMGFDAAFSDNDGQGREAQLTWHASDSELWVNTSLFGRIVFVKETRQWAANDSVFYCNYSTEAPTIDGNADRIWQSARGFGLARLVMGKHESPTDCAAYSKALWTEQGIYFLTTVQDNKVILTKGPIYEQADYGWISNEKGEKVWKIDPNKLQPAGGTTKNKVVDDKVTLSKGNYKLHYVSDESHSPAAWDHFPPTGNFYGIRLLAVPASQ